MNFLYCILLMFAAALPPESELLDAIRTDKYLAAGNHHTYLAPEKKIRDTRPPRGYRPFYFSHYGRHGSRYLTGSTGFISGYARKLDTLHVMGLLTTEGEKLREWVAWSESAHHDHSGMLTHQGYSEEKGISIRLYRRFRRIFSQRARRTVRYRSSPILRSAITGMSFVMELQKKAPKLDFDVDAGPEFYFTRWDPNPELDRTGNRIADSLFREFFDTTTFAARMFTHTDAAGKVLGGYASAANDIIHILGISRCIDPAADPFALFSEEELYAYAIAQNARTASWFIHSAETGCYRDTNAGSHLLMEVIAKAEEAIAGNDVCADLRFGHDSGVAPVLSLLHTKGYHECTPLAQSYISWPAYKHVSMACSFSFVFYRNRKGDILVKILENERETTIPAISPTKGPYYRWSELKAYCEGLCSPQV